MMRSKKGQYFVVAAVILIIMAMGIVSSNMLGSNDRYIFRLLHENFLTESHMAINSAAGSGEDISSSYLDFVNRFRDYAESRNVEFDLVYVLAYDDTMTVANFIGTDIEVITTNQRAWLAHGNVTGFRPERHMEVYVDGSYYSFEFGEDDVQLKALFDISSR